MDPITPTHVRYIKLGKANVWARQCLERGEIQFGYKDVPHDLCLRRDWIDVEARFQSQDGLSPGKAKDRAREIRSFYELGSDCLWITFADNHLWWAFAEPEVTWLGETETHGARRRRTIGPWRNSDIHGRPLAIRELSSHLTQVAAYRQTLCQVAAKDYLLQRINDEDSELLKLARTARDASVGAARAMIAKLHQTDLETMADLIFARAGWRRISVLGKTQKDIDLALEHPTTGHRAVVQVKSRSTSSEIRECIEAMATGFTSDHVFFLCPISTGQVSVDQMAYPGVSIHLWVDARLAVAAGDAGLYDWLMERVV
jgi:hypothetical protein